MLNDSPASGAANRSADPADLASSEADGQPDGRDAGDPAFDDSLVNELAALIDDGRTYAEAEIAFQKTRATLAGKSIGLALGFAVVAVILLHIALLALAVGMVMALAPLVSIWGAIAIVVGVLLLGTATLGYTAMSRGKLVGAMFRSEKDSEKSPS